MFYTHFIHAKMLCNNNRSPEAVLLFSLSSCLLLPLIFQRDVHQNLPSQLLFHSVLLLSLTQVTPPTVTPCEVFAGFWHVSCHQDADSFEMCDHEEQIKAHRSPRVGPAVVTRVLGLLWISVSSRTVFRLRHQCSVVHANRKKTQTKAHKVAVMQCQRCRAYGRPVHLPAGWPLDPVG